MSRSLRSMESVDVVPMETSVWAREPNTINLPPPTTIALRDSELVYPLVLTMHCCPLSTYTSTSNNQIVSAATNNHSHDTLERPYPSWKSNNRFFSSRCPHNWSENWVLQTSSCEPSGSVESRISSSKNSFLYVFSPRQEYVFRSLPRSGTHTPWWTVQVLLPSFYYYWTATPTGKYSSMVTHRTPTSPIAWSSNSSLRWNFIYYPSLDVLSQNITVVVHGSDNSSTSNSWSLEVNMLMY